MASDEESPLPPLPKPKFLELIQPKPLNYQQARQDNDAEINNQEQQALANPETSQAVESKSKLSPSTAMPGYQERHQPEQGRSRLGRRVGKDTQTGAYIQQADYIEVTQTARRQGLYILGLQGYGKSGLLENLIIQDITQHIGVCVLDPKGELIDNVIARLPDSKKEQKVILFDINDKDYFPGLNLFACDDPTSDREIQFTLNQVTHVFEKAFGVSQPATPRIYDYLYNCAYALIANSGYTMMDIRLLLNNVTFRSQLLGNVTDVEVLDFWHTFYSPLSTSRQREEARQQEARELLRRLNDLTHDPLRYIIGQSHSTINLQEIMDEGKILLVKLNSRRFEKASKLIGSIIVALILNASANRQTKNQFNLYADEFQRFSTEDFATLLEEARYAAIGITMAHQNRGQLELSDAQADANLKQRTLSVGNLVVFRVPTDAESLAGQFTQEPEVAWIEVQKPQDHRRIEDEVVDEVEEDIMEVTQNPIDYLVSARGTHTNMRVQEITQNLLITKITAFKEQNPIKILVNNLLVAVMNEIIQAKTDEFIDLMQKIAISYADRRYFFQGDSSMLHFAKNRDFISMLVLSPTDWDNAQWEVIDSAQKRKLIRTLLFSPINREDITHQVIEDEVKKIIEKRPKKKLPEESNLSNMTRKEKLEYIEYSEYTGLIWDALEIRSFITNINALAEELAKEPIRIPTGKKKMVKRIRKQPVWLTDESDKITHQQPSEQEMTNRMARELINLPLFTARVKTTTAQGTEEQAIRTLKPEKGIRGIALQERIARIQAQNRTPDERGISYCRPRQEIETEIRQRQAQFNQPPEEPPEVEPPIQRHPTR